MGFLKFLGIEWLQEPKRKIKKNEATETPRYLITKSIINTKNEYSSKSRSRGHSHNENKRR